MLPVPRHNLLSLRKIEPPATTTSGIILAPTKQTRAQMKKGVIVAMGQDLTNPKHDSYTPDLKLGMLVLYSQLVPEPYEHEGEEFLAMHEEDVLYILDPNYEEVQATV